MKHYSYDSTSDQIINNRAKKNQGFSDFKNKKDKVGNIPPQSATRVNSSTIDGSKVPLPQSDGETTLSRESLNVMIDAIDVNTPNLDGQYDTTDLSSNSSGENPDSILKPSSPGGKKI